MGAPRNKQQWVLLLSAEDSQEMSFEVPNLSSLLNVCKVAVANLVVGGLEGRSFRLQYERRLIFLKSLKN